VTIEYRTIGSKDWRSVTISPEEYFDLEQGEEIDWDCVPRYNHAIDYLEVGKVALRNTRLTIVDPGAGVTKQINETFWNSGKNRAIERTDKGPQIDYWELILEVSANEASETWEILRLDRSEGVMTPNYHGFIQRLDDGSEVETKVEINHT